MAAYRMQMELHICGELEPVGGALGASCSFSSSPDGQGVMVAQGPPKFMEVTELHNVRWASSVPLFPTGAILPIIADYSRPATGQTGAFLALVLVQGGYECLTKSYTTGKGGGARAWTSVGLFALAP